MVLFASNGTGTKALTSATVARLRECDEIETYSECGWHCATGWKDNKIHVRVHAHTARDIDIALGRVEFTKDDWAQGKHFGYSA